MTLIVLDVGDTVTLTANIQPPGTPCMPSWTVQGSTATIQVSADGMRCVVTGVEIGCAQVTLTVNSRQSSAYVKVGPVGYTMMISGPTTATIGNSITLTLAFDPPNPNLSMMAPQWYIDSNWPIDCLSIRQSADGLSCTVEPTEVGFATIGASVNIGMQSIQAWPIRVDVSDPVIGASIVVGPVIPVNQNP